MKTTQLLPAMGLVATAAAGSWGQHNNWNASTPSPPAWITTTVTTDIYTTYCPEPTEVTMGTKTYTVTDSETLTITDCPCTYTTSYTSLPTPTPTPTSTWETTSYTTITTDVYTTYCPFPTEVTMGTKTYTVTENSTLTITDCPCTYTTPIPLPTWTAPPAPPAPAPPAPAPPAPAPPAPAPPAPEQPSHVPYPNITTTIIPLPPVLTTEVLPSFTTYCPSPTEIVQGSKTYTVTEPTTLTITDCPCTVTRTSTPPPITSTATRDVPVTEYTPVTSYITTVCPPESTEIIISSITYPVPTPGTVTIPITSWVPKTETTWATPAPPPATPTSVGTTIGTTYVPSKPSGTQPGPLQVTNAAVKNGAGVGAFAAVGLAAMLL